MQSQSDDSPLHDSPPSTCGGDGDPYTVLQSSVLPDAVNLGRQKDSAQDTISPHQLQVLALRLQENPHVTALDLSNQSIGADAMLELAGHFIRLTSLRELNLSGAFASGGSNTATPILANMCNAAFGVRMLQMRTPMTNSSYASPGNDFTGTTGSSFAFASSLAFLTALRVLNLSDNQIHCGHEFFHEEEAHSIEIFSAAFTSLQNLESLDLRGCYSWQTCVFGILRSLMTNFNLNTLHLPRFVEDTSPHFPWHGNFTWQRYGLPEPPAAVYSECAIKPHYHWIIILRHIQHTLFCSGVLHWNLRLQCNFQHLRGTPRPLCRSPLYSLFSNANLPNAISLTRPQQQKVLCLAGHTLLLLRLLMRDPLSNMQLAHQLYQTLRRINSVAVSVRLLEVGMTRVSITTSVSSPPRLTSLFVNLSDTVRAVQTKLLRTLSDNPTFIDECASLIRFHFDGKELLHSCSLAQCGIKPNDIIHMTLLQTRQGQPGILLKTLSGQEFDLGVQPSDTVDSVKLKFWFKVGYPFDNFSFRLILFNGTQKDARTTLDDGRRLLSDYDVPVNGKLYVVQQLKGGLGVLVSRADFTQMPSGDVLPASCCTGAQWLMHPVLPTPLPSPVDVAALVRSFASEPLSSTMARCPNADAPIPFSCVTEEACVALRKCVDQAHSLAFESSPCKEVTPHHHGAHTELACNLVASNCKTDFRLLLSLPQLRAIVGSKSCDLITSALEASAPDAIVLRRTVATGSWIGFHTDTVARTVQIPLTDDCECEGGLMVFACSDGRLVHARRRVGAVLAHDGDAVHGVTALVKGVSYMYGLFVLRARSLSRV